MNFPVTNVQVTRTKSGIRICGELAPPPVQLGGTTIPIPPVPVCVDISRDQVVQVLGDVVDESKRFWNRVRGWFRT